MSDLKSCRYISESHRYIPDSEKAGDQGSSSSLTGSQTRNVSHGGAKQRDVSKDVHSEPRESNHATDLNDCYAKCLVDGCGKAYKRKKHLARHMKDEHKISKTKLPTDVTSCASPTKKAEW